MSFSLAALLLHEEDVPEPARYALRRASTAPVGVRRAYLEAAAEVLYRDAHLDCDDARELVGLSD